MGVATVSVEFVFEEAPDEDDPGHVYYRLSGISSLRDGLSQDALSGIVEGWAQSDFYWVGVTGAILDALDGQVVEREDIKW